MSLKSEKKTADKFAQGHHQGKFYGYNVDHAGRVFPAPTFTNRMAKIIDRQIGVNDLLLAVEKYVADELSRLAMDRRKWWNDVVEDIGIDISDPWQYNSNERYISKKPDVGNLTNPPEKKP